MTSGRSRTGVLTFHRCINYGSYWQARCLVDGLRARGHHAVIVDHDSRHIRRAEWTCALQPVLPTPVPLRDRPRYALKILRFERAVAALPRSTRFALEDPGAMERFDRVVVGSDEVWNLRHPWYGGCALFFGEGLQADRLIAHAASFGSYGAWEGLSAIWAERLSRFASISVRDENARSLVGHALGRAPDLVLDPCLQFRPRPEGPWRGPKEPFVAVYGHNFSPRFARHVRRWARERGLPLVSIGYRNAWADAQWLTAGPHDFAHGMARAAAVATNFFHGCVFALRNARPFVCETTPYRSTKVSQLLAALGAERHLVGEETPRALYAACLDGPLESGILDRVDDLRAISDAYLDRVGLGRIRGAPAPGPARQG